MLPLVLWPLALLASIVGTVMAAIGRGRKRPVYSGCGASLLVLVLMWLLLAPWWLYLRPPRRELRAVSADGKSVVYLRRGWMNRDVIEWKSPHGGGGLYLGDTDYPAASRPGRDRPETPQGFIWLPGGDRFFIFWGEMGLFGGPLIGAALGDGRQPTRNEARWLGANQDLWPAIDPSLKRELERRLGPSGPVDDQGGASDAIGLRLEGQAGIVGACRHTSEPLGTDPRFGRERDGTRLDVGRPCRGSHVADHDRVR